MNKKTFEEKLEKARDEKRTWQYYLGVKDASEDIINHIIGTDGEVDAEYKELVEDIRRYAQFDPSSRFYLE